VIAAIRKRGKIMNVTVHLSKGRLFKIWGHRLIFSEYPDFQFAVNLYVNNDEEITGNYTVTELSTGACLAIRPTVKSAIVASREMLHENGIEGIRKAIKAFNQKWGPGPIKVES
jgi:hypothetical protein